MDALMDMLEKTITVEDTHDLLQEVEDRVSGRVTEESEKVARMEEDLQGVHDKLEASAEHIVARVDDTQKDIAEGMGRLEAQILDLSQELERKILETNSNLEIQLGQANADLGTFRETFAGDLSNMQDGLARSMRELDQSCSQKVDGLAGSLEQEVSANSAAMQDASEQLRGHVSAKMELLDSKVQSTVDVLAVQMQTATQNLDKRVTVAVETMASNHDMLEKKLDTNCANLVAKLQNDLDLLREQSDGGFVQLYARVDEEIKTLHDRLTRETDKTSQESEAVGSRVDTTSQALQARFNEQFSILEGQMSSMSRNSAASTVTVKTQLDALEKDMQQFVSRVGALTDVAQGDLAKVDRNLTEAIAKLNADLLQLRQQSSSRCGVIEKDMASKFLEQSTMISGQYSHFEEQYKSVDQSSGQRTAEQEARLEDFKATLATIQLQFGTSVDTLDQKLGSAAVAHQDQLGNLRQHLTDLCGTMDKKFTAKDAAQQFRLETQEQQTNKGCAQIESSMTSE